MKLYLSKKILWHFTVNTLRQGIVVLEIM